MGRETASGILLTLLIASMLFSAISLVKGQTETHDLRVELEAGLSSGGHHLTFGKSRILNVTVWNDGNVTEPTVTLLLLINDSEAVHSIVSNLSNGTSSGISYTWYPAESNVYNITAYAPPITYPEPETNTANNVASWLVYACNDTAPTVDFTYSPRLPGPVAGENVTFDASASYDPDWGNITAYSWNFNGTTKNTNASVYTYNFTKWGNATVALTLYDTENKTSSASRNITVYARPTASFAVAGLYYVNKTLTFNATSSFDPDNIIATNKGIMNYSWNFGDTNTTSTSEPLINHTYSIEKDYTVFLNVTDFDDLVSTATSKLVSIGSGRPVADFTPPPGPCYVNQWLFFNASASHDPDNEAAANRGIAYYYWDFNDTITANLTTSTTAHLYQNPGNYSVNLTVTDFDDGLTSSTKKTVKVELEVFVKVEDASTGNTTVIHNPGETFTVNITVENVENLYSFYFKLSWPSTWMPPTWLDLFDPDTVTVVYPKDGFLGPKQDPGTGKTRVKWEPIIRADEGYVIVNATLLVNEPCNGNGTLAIITLKAATSGNCSLGLSNIVLSESFESITPIDNSAENGTFYTPWPVASFIHGPPDPTVNMNVTFDALWSYDPDGGYITSYEWNFDNGNYTTTSDPKIIHTFNSSRVFNVNLTVTDDELDKWWIIYPVNVAAGRDVAVVGIDLSTLQLNATLGQYETAGILPVNVTVKNGGNSVSENFSVTIYFDNTSIETKLVTNLKPGENTTVKFHWDIQYVTKGVYNVSAYAWPVTGETDTSDNTLYADHLVIVYLQGDINRSNETDLYDAILLSSSLNSKPGDPTWNPNADLNCDGMVDLYDAIILAKNINRKDP